MRKLDKWSTLAAAAVIVAALLACKKEEAPPPVATQEPAPEPPKVEETPEASTTTTKTDDVKRYGSEEQTESGTVRVNVHHAKIFREADETTDHIATLSKGTLVNRKARKGTFMLIDYPSGVGVLSPAWIPLKQLTTLVEKVKIEQITQQEAGVAATATATTTASAEPVPTTTATASAAPTATASAAPTATATATAAPTTSAPTKGRLKLPFKLPQK